MKNPLTSKSEPDDSSVIFLDPLLQKLPPDPIPDNPRLTAQKTPMLEPVFGNIPLPVVTSDTGPRPTPT